MIWTLKEYKVQSNLKITAQHKNKLDTCKIQKKNDTFENKNEPDYWKCPYLRDLGFAKSNNYITKSEPGILGSH